MPIIRVVHGRTCDKLDWNEVLDNLIINDPFLTNTFCVSHTCDSEPKGDAKTITKHRGRPGDSPGRARTMKADSSPLSQKKWNTSQVPLSVAACSAQYALQAAAAVRTLAVCCDAADAPDAAWLPGAGSASDASQ